MRLLGFTALLCSAIALAALVQPKPGDAGDLDAVTKEAAALETQLSKTRNTTPEAGELMLKLIDLYHQHGRGFGLVRVGQAFVAVHTTHPRHKDAMLQLMDGLRITGRSKELIATGRQFLVRYPNDAASGEVERDLGRMLERNREPAAAAAMYEAAWKRLGPTPAGIQAGRSAIAHYTGFNNPEGWTKAATLADDMVDKMPAAPVVSAIAWTAVDAWERINGWAKANLSGNKLLQKNLPLTPSYLQQLHHRMGENYSRQAQHANAVESFRKALAVPGFTINAHTHGRLLGELYSANVKPNIFEPVLNEYVKNFPDREERHGFRTMLAILNINDKQLPRADQLLIEVLPFDARTHNPIGHYIGLLGSDPVKYAAGEQVLKAAIAKSKPYNAAALRYSLAFDLYRDRMKNLPAARATARELAFTSPTNDGSTTTAITWLLDTTSNDTEFQQDVAAFLATRKKFPYWATYRDALSAWATAQAPRKEKEIQQRVTYARAQLVPADADAAFADWLAYEKATRESNVAQINALRTKLTTAPFVNTLPDDLANELFYNHQYWHRHHGNAQQQQQSAVIARDWTKRLPKSDQAAWNYLAWTTDLSVVAEYKGAAAHYLTFDLPAHNPDAYRRIAQCVLGAKDPVLAKTMSTWLEKHYQKYGFITDNAASIGDTLDALGLKQEARSCWERGMNTNKDHYDSRTCFDRIMTLTVAEPDKVKLIDQMLAYDGYWQFYYAILKADRYLKVNDLANFDKVLRETADKARARPFVTWSPDQDWSAVATWVSNVRGDMKMTPADKRKVFTTIRDLKINRPSAVAAAALLELPEELKLPPMQRLLALHEATMLSYGDVTDWDYMMTYAQTALARKDYPTAATLLAAMLANHPTIDEGRRKPGRDMITQAYSRMGAAGSAIDDTSPIAPLLQAAMHLRLGDNKLAFETYMVNQKLFDQNKTEVPVDLLVFVCESHMAAGGDENANRVEDICRAWIIKHGENKDIDDSEKARVQILLGRNFFKSKRYELARTEFQSVVNRFAKTPQAIEAEFGIGETYMEQKVYDQAEQTFEKLALSADRDTAIRAEFLRGVLANRRGERDEARGIFRRVLERVPTVELANQVLYNLSEVYGAEQRYVDQLELLRTVGRLGRSSKRYHTPGDVLSIVVQDSDLGVSRGHARIPVRVWTEPGGDEEVVNLLSGGAGKGLFRADLDTRLGAAAKNDRVLQITGKDVIRCDYPDAFKKEFKDVPLPDAEIRIAADGKLDLASSKIIDETEEGFSERLAREAKGEEDKRKSLGRPKDQIKPGNLVYLRVVDPDRDVSDKPDVVTVKLTSASGDQVQATLTETGPHTGIFEGSAKTGELPAGALATNTAIDHSPLMAIDKDPKSKWLSEPDGATPKTLTIDMKDLKRVDRVVVHTPDAKQHTPVRMTLEGSDDGRLWFKLASNPIEPAVVPLVGKYERMSLKLFENQNSVGWNWNQIVELSKTGKPTSTADVDKLEWARAMDGKKVPMTALWSGKLVQPRAGAARITVRAETNAILLNGQLVLPPGNGERSADVWLDKGSHDLAIFAAIGAENPGMHALIARADNNVTELVPIPFRETDFDLKQVEAKPAPERKPGTVAAKEIEWDFKFPAVEVRHVRLVIHEYKGEAVAINHVEIQDAENKKVHLPTETDILSLATNDVLEIAGGDLITASYIDDSNLTGSSRLLTGQLRATYHNASTTTIAHDVLKNPNGEPYKVRKELLRIEPGERIVIEVTDYDQDRTAKPDEIKVFVRVNDDKVIELTATETDENTGVFTKEVDTSDKDEADKIKVKPGDRVYCWYVDEQNTLPGHSVKRETTVYVNEPAVGQVRILETRALIPKEDRSQVQITYPPAVKDRKMAGVALLAPLTVEVIDKDAAKDSLSKVIVVLTTTDGAKVEVECILDDRQLDSPNQLRRLSALQEGRFTGQVIMQLGGKDSPSLVPLGADMPRNLIGGPVLPKEEGMAEINKSLVTRVLNVTGKDVINATYVDVLRPSDPNTKLSAEGRIITDGVLVCSDVEYQKEVTAVHVGERLFLKVTDADQDRTGERDIAKVIVKTKRGEEETIELVETLAHSGVFTGSVTLKPSEKPEPKNLVKETPEIECFFGDTLELVYNDELSGSMDGMAVRKLEVQVVRGTDGKLSAFSKRFTDEALAVETRFHIAESHFELFKSHKGLGRDAEAKTDLEAGRKILREVMEDYPNPKYTPRVAFLLGQFAQELGQYKEAIESYRLIVKVYPDHVLAPDAQFKLAQSFEEMKEFTQALDEYVTLAATYPKNPLIANVMLRISEHFYKQENFKVAAQVGEKFTERFEGHKSAPKMAFRIGQCYFKDKQFIKGAEAFDAFNKKFNSDPLAADAMFWAGESYRMGGQIRKAFHAYNRCRHEYASSESAKYARGRLALPEMQRLFEEDANLDK